ncbi:hypothetical protein BKA62DRAFT_717478 [Auriculariales sp. MPI-PUGE-AT-0066]|nr:hypothetical protein BKA62DRAFT_717478 [Auriculariales sp. MPI-PUGE-AT-0066]
MQVSERYLDNRLSEVPTLECRSDVPQFALNRLPHEIWIYALRLLSTFALARSMRVSHAWRAMVLDPLLWTNLQLFPLDMTVESMDTVLQRSGHRDLCLQMQFTYAFDCLFALTKIGEHMSHVHTLDLFCGYLGRQPELEWPQVKAGVLAMLRQPAPRLTALNLTLPHPYDDHLSIPDDIFCGIAPMLRIVHLRDCSIVMTPLAFSSVIELRLNGYIEQNTIQSVSMNLAVLEFYVRNFLELPPLPPRNNIQKVVVHSIEGSWTDLYLFIRQNRYGDCPLFIINLPDGRSAIELGCQAVLSPDMSLELHVLPNTDMRLTATKWGSAHVLQIHTPGRTTWLLDKRFLGHLRSIVLPDMSDALPSVPVPSTPLLTHMSIACGSMAARGAKSIFDRGTLPTGYRFRAAGLREIRIIRAPAAVPDPLKISAVKLATLWKEHFAVAGGRLSRLVMTISQDIEFVETEQELAEILSFVDDIVHA